MKLTDEQVRMLAQAERDMDSGKLPYVIVDGQRNLMTDDVMAHFKLTSGQTISNAIMIAILEFKIETCQRMRNAH